MWGVGLLIFYVANVANVANVIQVHFVAFCDRLSHTKAVPLHRISKRAEIANKSLTKKSKTQNYGICRNYCCREQLRRKICQRQQAKHQSVLPRCSCTDAGGVSERYLRHTQRRRRSQLRPHRGQQGTRLLRDPRPSVESLGQMVHLLPRLAYRRMLN